MPKPLQKGFIGRIRTDIRNDNHLSLRVNEFCGIGEKIGR
jgi:hypothetical protein